MINLPQYLRDRLNPLRHYVQQIRRHRPGRGGIEEIRLVFSNTVPKDIQPLWPCRCGGEHPLLFTVAGSGHIFARAYTRATANCGPLFPIRLIAEFFEESIHQLTATVKTLCVVGTVRPSEHIADHGTKEHRIVDVRKPTAGGPIQHKPGRNLTAPEVVAFEDLVQNQYPAPRYKVLRVGGTPDFFAFDTWNKTPSGIIAIECKSGRDRLDAETQAPIMLMFEEWKLNAGVMMVQSI